MANLEKEFDFFKKSSKRYQKDAKWLSAALFARPFVLFAFASYVLLPVILSEGYSPQTSSIKPVASLNSEQNKSFAELAGTLPSGFLDNQRFRYLAWGSSQKVISDATAISGKFSIEKKGNNFILNTKGTQFQTPQIANTSCVYSPQELNVSSKDGIMPVYCYSNDELVAGVIYSGATNSQKFVQEINKYQFLTELNGQISPKMNFIKSTRYYDLELKPQEFSIVNKVQLEKSIDNAMKLKIRQQTIINP